AKRCEVSSDCSWSSLLLCVFAGDFLGEGPMAEFKPISRDAVPLALEKAERYRLLNEPAQAESICLDVLAVDPENQQALVMLLLALTDQFRGGPADCYAEAEAVVPKLHS